MSLLLPVTTFVLVVVGALCLFIAIENDRRLRKTARSNRSVADAVPMIGSVSYAHQGYMRSERE